MEQLLREDPEVGITLVPVHPGMWHPVITVCPRCDHHEEVTTRLRCPCQQPRWRRALGKAVAEVEAPWWSVAKEHKWSAAQHHVHSSRRSGHP